jgi:hypothetical protein
VPQGRDRRGVVQVGAGASPSGSGALVEVSLTVRSRKKRLWSSPRPRSLSKPRTTCFAMLRRRYRTGRRASCFGHEVASVLGDLVVIEVSVGHGSSRGFVGGTRVCGGTLRQDGNGCQCLVGGTVSAFQRACLSEVPQCSRGPATRPAQGRHAPPRDRRATRAPRSYTPTRSSECMRPVGLHASTPSRPPCRTSAVRPGRGR